jgi:crotonobetainyl-CoA:carnitine CoA-transferase CaiB-like acyl-CoA transferase
MNHERALAGITVIDLTRYLPGPYCTRLLADLGARVIKIEPPQGDPVRRVAWSIYDLLNAGKEILTLDLSAPKALGELHALLAGAQVCVEGFKPATARDIGVDGVTLTARYPDLVHCSISGYGQTGPDADRAAHDLNYQADAGLLGAVGPPQVPGLLIADVTAAYQAAIAILAALVRRQGTMLDVSLVNAARAWVPLVPPPVLRGDFACYNVYETSDRRWIALGALESKFWERFCRGVGRPDWVVQQYATGPARVSLLDNVRALFRSRSQDEWLAALAPLDCCVSAIADARVQH